MQSWRAVQEHRSFLDHFFQNFPNLRTVAFYIFLGAFDIVCISLIFQPGNYEWAVKLQRHCFRQTALVQLEMGPNHNNGTTRIVDTLAQQVSAEAALLAFEHIRERAQFPAASSAKHAPSLGIIDQAVNSFLQHTFFIAHDHVRSAQFEQSFQTIVAVDHASIEIIQVRSGKTAAVQLNHRAQIGRDHR